MLLDFLYSKKLENYLISGDEANLNTVVPSSKEENFIKFLKMIKEQKDSKEPNFKLIFDTISTIKDYSVEELVRKIAFEEEFNHPNTSDLRKEELVKFVSVNMGEPYRKPENLKKNVFDEEINNKTKKYKLDVLDDTDSYIAKFLSGDMTVLEKFKSNIINKFFDFNLIQEELLQTLLTEDGRSIFDVTKKANLASLEFIKTLANTMDKMTKNLSLTDKLIGLFNQDLDYFKKSFSLEQLEVFIEAIKNNANLDSNSLIDRILTIKYESRISSASNTEKANIYQEMRDYLLKYVKQSENVLLIQLDFSILKNNQEMNIYDFDALINYLKNPLFVDSYQIIKSKELEEKVNNRLKNNRKIINSNLASSNSYLLTKYLEYFFLFGNKEIDDFSEYIEINYLKQLYYKAKLLKGEEDNNYLSVLGKEQYTSLSNMTQITICDFNKKVFQIDEQIELTLDIKNINTLFVEIFEINTENYYLKNLSTLDSNVNLEGLISTFKKTYVMNEKPTKINRKSFVLDSIPNKRGLYIIEFIGNGYCSRAIVQKGSLSFINKHTEQGLLFYILNENLEFCKDSTTGIWIGSKFYKTINDEGAILIPFTSNVGANKIIMVNENFAEIAETQLFNENYEFDVNYFVNEESFIMGGTSKILINSNIYLKTFGRIKLDLGLLKNTNITLTIYKEENAILIPIINKYDDVKLENDKEYSIDFQVPPKLKSVKVEINTVMNGMINKSINLYSSKNFEVKSENQKSYSNSVLSYSNESGYFVQIIGKNGEPKENIEVVFNLTHKFLVQLFSSKLSTNSEGKIILGKLDNYKEINIVYEYATQNFNENYYIDQTPHYQINNEYEVIEGYEILLPIESNTFNINNYDLIYNRFGYKIENHLNNQENYELFILNNGSFEKTGKSHYNLKLKNLKAGEYHLFYYNNLVTRIVVKKGFFWNYNSFIKTEKAFGEVKQILNPLYFEELNFDAKNNQINIKVKNHSDSTRVHIFAYNYSSKYPFIKSNCLEKSYSSCYYKREFSSSLWNNIYLSNKILSEEIKYVLDRQNCERYNGNTLEKPSLLMKRKFIRNTTTEIFEAQTGTQFASVKAPMRKQQICKAREDKKECFRVDQDIDDDFCEFGQEKKKKKKEKECKRRYSFTSNEFILKDLSTINAYVNGNLNTINFTPNYLNIQPIIIENSRLNSEGKLQLTFENLDKYPIINVLVVDKDSYCEDFISNHLINSQNGLNNKDLSLKTILNPTKVFSENRSLSIFLKDEEFSINDITAVSYKLIDSLDKYLFYLQTTRPNVIKDFSQDFIQLTKFDTLTNEEIDRFLSDKISIETNVYLYFKHNDFFNKSIRQVIELKSEKTLIDYLLLQDYSNIKKFINPFEMKKFDALQTCLFIYFMRDKEPEVCKLMYKNMKYQFDELVAKTNNYQITLKTNFNTLINMKTSDDVKDVAKSKDIERVKLEKEAKFSTTNNCVQKSVSDIYKQANLFKESGVSKEYKETHFYNSDSQYINSSKFWVDLAGYFIDKSDVSLISKNKKEKNNSLLSPEFLSTGIVNPVNSASELVFVLAFIDIPKNSISHDYSRIGDLGVKIKFKNSCLLLIRDISETKESLKNSLMINYYVTRLQDFNRNDDKCDTKEEIYIKNEIYVLEVIVTNISSKNIDFELLVQIPEKSIPVNNSDYTKTINMSLNSFQTKTDLSYIYFPQIGKFSHYPPTCNLNGEIISKAVAKTFNVLETWPKISSEEFKSFNDVLEFGSKTEIINFIKSQKSIKLEDINKLNWLYSSDKQFCLDLMTELSNKGLFYSEVWRYAANKFYSVKAYKDLNPHLGNLNRNDMKFTLNTINDHLDYHPIINSRVHGINKDDTVDIRNNELKQTYFNFVVKNSIDLFFGRMNSYKYLRLSYYLLLQDRYEDAINVFSKVDVKSFDNLHSYKLQYDYISAYIEFTKENFEIEKVKKICEVNKDVPLTFWKNMFEEISDQVMEYEGKIDFAGVEEMISMFSNDPSKSKLKASLEEPRMSIEVVKDEINLKYYNLSEVKIKFYNIDIETLFSVTPFIKQVGEKFAFYKPKYEINIPLTKEYKENIKKINLKDYFKDEFNFFFEVVYNGKSMYDISLSNSFNISISEIFGEIRVTDNNNSPLSKTYVKVFAQLDDGSIKFYKDGYTDLRGKFNYISINTDLLKRAAKFSILVIDEKYGSYIKEANKPEGVDDITSKVMTKTEIEEFKEIGNDFDKIKNLQIAINRTWKNQKKK
jgi:hypothetical protein